MAIEVKPKEAAANSEVAKYKIGDVLELMQPAPEHSSVPVGCVGVVYAVAYDADKKMNRYFANWTNIKNMNGEFYKGYIYEKNVKPYTGGTDITAILMALGMMLIVQGEHRMPSASKETIKKLGSAWDGSLQGLLEMVAWMDSSEKVQQTLKTMKMGFFPDAFETVYNTLKQVSDLKTASSK